MGFIIKKGMFGENVPNNYLHYEGDINVAYDPNVPFLSFYHEGVGVIIIGDIFSIEDQSSPDEIICFLANELYKNEFYFFQSLKKIWGRFALIYSSPTSGTNILTDATSMRGVFYSTKDSVICSSHPYLVGNVNSTEVFPIKYGYPGNKTPIQDVKILTPNTMLNLDTGEINRFYPGIMQVEYHNPKTTTSVATAFVVSCKNILKKLANSDKKLCVTLTGGLDSRVTLALLMLSIPEQITKIKFITYKNNNTGDFDRDVEVSKILAKKYNLDHVVFDRNNFSNPELRKDAVMSTYYHSGSGLLAAYKNILNDEEYVHIRSNIYEIGRGYYLSQAYARAAFKGNYLSDLPEIYRKSLKTKKTEDFYSSIHNVNMCDDAFQDFFQDVDFKQAIRYFHPLDIFYWEHRMGTWMPHVYLETDHVFNTLSLPNNWMILESMMNLPLNDRLGNTLFNEVLSMADEFLSDLPINPKNRVDIQKYVEPVVHLKDEHCDEITISNLSLKSKLDESNKIVPSVDYIGTADEVVSLKNVSGDNVYSDITNFVFKEHLWFVNNRSSLNNMFFSANTLTLDFKKTPVKHIFYLLLGDEKSNSLRTNDLFKIDNLGDSINVSVTLKGEDKAKVSVFLQEFQLNEKVKSKSYPLVLGGNNIVFNKHPSSTALKLLFRFSHDDSGQITLSNLTVKPKNIEEIIPPKSDDKVFIHDEIPIEYDKVQPHIVKVGSLDTNILTCFKSNSKKLVVFFNGAVNIDKTPLPVYQRHSWLEKLPYSSMIIMDPTIYDFLNETESSYITWYQGDKDSFFLENLNPIIEGVTKELGVKYENVAFYGSSAGGFAALMSASMLKGSKACVVNPQVDALKYHKKYSQKILSHLGINADGKPPSKMRLNVIDYFEEKSSFPFVYYKQNKQDVLHYQQHFMLLNDSYINNHQHDKMISDITDDERGHTAIPLYDEAFIDIEKTFSLGNDTNVNLYNEILPLRIFGFNSNKSTFFSFKPRTDVASYNLSYPLDWNLDPFNDRNWCFQLNSWRHLDLTLLTLDKQFDEVIFNRVIDVIFDWERHSITEQNLNDYTWYDMATGLRALKLAFIINRFSHVNSSFKISNERKLRILEIARHHLSELNRQPLSINNHGIFQAHGLVVLSLCLGNEVSIQHGIMKMEELIEQQFNSDGYHVENSDKYHWFVLDTFDEFLNLDVYRASSKIRENLNLSRLVKFWTIFPNKESLMIGDSEYKVRDLDFSTANHQCDPDSYIVKHFEDSGYLFVRSCFDSDPTSASMLFFQTAYKNNTHRHADDFNVLLYEFGMNILVDAGQYAYSKDKERDYILSTKAHNSLVIDDKSYQLKDKMYYESSLKFCDEIDNTFIFKTELHRTKPQVNHSRIIFYKPSDFLIVIDKVDSNTLRKFDQVWHFHQDLDVSRFNDFFAADINEDIKMNIYPSAISLDSNFLHTKNVVNNLSIVKGQVEPELQGWRSLKYRELTPNYALTNSINAKKALLITKFIFTDSNDNPSDLEVTYDINGGNIILTVLSKSLNVDVRLSI